MFLLIIRSSAPDPNGNTGTPLYLSEFCQPKTLHHAAYIIGEPVSGKSLFIQTLLIKENTH